MLKPINVKNLTFTITERMRVRYNGFAILDTDTNTIVSYDGTHPYVLNTKKIIQSVIDGGCADKMPRVSYN